MAIFRRYAAMFRVGTSFIFSSIKSRSASVTLNLICTVLLRPSMCSLLSFPFRGFGTLPNKQFSTDAPQDGRAKIRKRVLFSYACYETLSLTTYNTGNGKFDELSQKKNAAICDVSITLYKQKRENFIPPFRRCWLPLFLLQ